MRLLDEAATPEAWDLARMDVVAVLSALYERLGARVGAALDDPDDDLFADLCEISADVHDAIADLAPSALAPGLSAGVFASLLPLPSSVDLVPLDADPYAPVPLAPTG